MKKKGMGWGEYLFTGFIVVGSLFLICMGSWGGISIEPKGFNVVQYETNTSTFGATTAYKPGAASTITWTNAVNEIEIVYISTHPVPTLYANWFEITISTHKAFYTVSSCTEKLDKYNLDFQTSTYNAVWTRKYYTSQTTIYVDTGTVNSCPINMRITGRGWRW